MTGIDNSGILNVCYSCGNAGFAPGLSYGYVLATKVLTITDTSVFGAGDGLKAINLMVTDKKGNVKRAQITVAAGNAVIDLSTGFAPQYGYNITASVVTNFRAVGDLSVYEVANPLGSIAGVLGYPGVNIEGNGLATVEP